MGGHPGHVRAVDVDVTPRDRGQPDQTAGQCRLAYPVAAKQGDDPPISTVRETPCTIGDGP
jgi:hypothetical protein